MNVEISIGPPKTAQNGVLSAFLDVGGKEFLYPDIERDLCKKFTCPLEAGVETNAKYELIDGDFFPAKVIRMKWEAKDFNNNVIFCAIAQYLNQP